LDRPDHWRLRAAASGLLVALSLCGAAQAKDGAAGAASAPRREVEYIIAVVALTDAEKVERLIDRLAKARLPYYVEPIATARGTVYRVRVGPYGERAAAAKTLKQLEAMGLKPGAIFERP
jgi:cell division septation protein DedD